MKILLTGASSFTGFWFVRELAAAGHEVTAVLRHRAEDYSDPLRRTRVELGAERARAVHGVSFGDEQFLALVKEGGWDLLAHHAADVTNYRSMEFDPVAALQNNVRGLPAVLEALRGSGCRKVLLTGSVFENGEGAGSQGLPDFSPYGLSKALTAQAFRYYCGRSELHLGKFVVANPFGAYEEPRYTAYLLKSWLRGETPSCNNPSYVRDNIHVSLLARAYVAFAEALPSSPGFSRRSPSGYVESQGAFTLRVAAEMRARLGLPCAVELRTQVEFAEPRVRINVDVPELASRAWDERAAWDEMAQYYEHLHGRR